MDEKPDQIIGQIEAQREELGRNLNELETRVRSTADWRTHFDKNPMVFLGVALGGGILLGSIVANRGEKGSSYSSSSSSYGASSASFAASTPKASKPPGPATLAQKSKVHDTIDQVKAALIAFGVAKAKEFIMQAIPGFDQHMSEAERHASSQQRGSGYNYPSHTEPVGAGSGMSL